MIRTETGKWCISNDGEMYDSSDFETKEQAIESARRDYEYSNFHVAKVVNLEFEENDINLSDEVYEHLAEQLCEECGEASEGGEATKEQLDELDKIIAKTVMEWIEKNDLQPNCFGVADEEEVRGD